MQKFALSAMGGLFRAIRKRCTVVCVSQNQGLAGYGVLSVIA
jgi:hypothetical protein